MRDVRDEDEVVIATGKLVVFLGHVLMRKAGRRCCSRVTSPEIHGGVAHAPRMPGRCARRYNCFVERELGFSSFRGDNEDTVGGH